MDQKAIKRSTMSVREMANELGICLPSAYELTRRRDFPAIALGRRIVIPRVSFERWLEEQAKGGA